MNTQEGKMEEVKNITLEDLKVLCSLDTETREKPKTITLEELKNLPTKFSYEIELENKNTPVLTHISEKVQKYFLTALESDTITFPYDVFLFEHGDTIMNANGELTKNITIVKRVVENAD